VDVSTLQGETLGRVNMSKIKPYHELLETKTYVLEIGHTTNSAEKETYPKQCSPHYTNHQNVYSSYLNVKERPNDFSANQKEILTFPEYDEVHHKMLECYFIQTAPREARDEPSTKITSKGCYFIHVLPRGTINETPAKREPTTNIEGLTKRTKGDYYKDIVSHEYGDSTISTLYDHDTTITTKDNTHVGDISKHARDAFINNWLPHTYKIVSLISMMLIMNSWYLQAEKSSIHSSLKRVARLKKAQETGNYYAIQISEEEIRPQIGEMRICNHRRIQKGQENAGISILLYKTKDKSNLVFLGRGPHKADPKKIEETTTQGSDFLVDSSKTCKNHTHLYNNNLTSQHNYMLKQSKAQGMRKLIGGFKFNTWSELPPHQSITNDTISWVHHM
jgi:hypothetical protein